MVTEAFLLTRQWRDTSQGLQLELWFTSDSGPLCVLINHQTSLFFIHQDNIEPVKKILSTSSYAEIKPLDLQDFRFQPVAAIYFNSQHQLYRARDLLRTNNIPCFESDIRPTERFLTERFITAPVRISSRNGIQANQPILNPRLQPSEYQPTFKILSLDIETSYNSNELFSIAFVCGDVQRVLMIGDPMSGNKSPDYIHYVRDEHECLSRFIESVQQLDPDLFIGWNVINFDFRFLQQKADQLKLALNIGRGHSAPQWRQAQGEHEHFFLLIPGRVVLDGIDTLKSATFQFPSFSLDAVANTLLDRSKLIQAEKNHDRLYKAKEIKRLFHEDKPALAAYNLEDCQLVLDIFAHTELIHFAIERASLTGLEMDRMGGSVAAFDNLYLPRLHRKGFVAPNIGDYSSTDSAPGGYVMDSKPGLYDSVLVLDYKSLYPSIIRTFKVDPYARIVAKQQSDNDTVPGFGGARFSKVDNILPGIIEQLWSARDRAKTENNKALSQAIKIIMNSFYGVLGTPGCRIHDVRLTSSITRRSHEIIKHTVTLIEQQGYDVIYGDTDSVFVSLKQVCNPQQADHIGHQLIDLINDYWHDHLASNYGIDSFLEMEYETHFNKFFMPTVRGSDKGSKKRYAGLINDKNGQHKIIFKGLETVRTDWTALARDFQQELYERIFNNQPYAEFIRDTVTTLKSGQLDDKLNYRKRLRQKLTEYTKNIPPHARAAIKAEEIFKKNRQPSRYQNKGWIEYVITVNGPETLECQSSRLDYQHYIDKQLIPVADSILSILNDSMEALLDQQIQLF